MLFETFQDTCLCKQKIVPVDASNINSANDKPRGGLWASPVNANFKWSDFCEQDSYYRKSVRSTFGLRSKAKVLVLTSPLDALKYPICKDDRSLLKAVAQSTWFSEPYCLEWLGNPGLRKNWGYLIREWDAMLVFAGSNHGLRFLFQGWDCDSLLVFNPDIVTKSPWKWDYFTYPQPVYNSNLDSYVIPVGDGRCYVVGKEPQLGFKLCKSYPGLFIGPGISDVPRGKLGEVYAYARHIIATNN